MEGYILCVNLGMFFIHWVSKKGQLNNKGAFYYVSFCILDNVYLCKIAAIFSFTIQYGEFYNSKYLIYIEIYQKKKKIVKLLQHKYSQILKITKMLHSK